MYGSRGAGGRRRRLWSEDEEIERFDAAGLGVVPRVCAGVSKAEAFVEASGGCVFGHDFEREVVVRKRVAKSRDAKYKQLPHEAVPPCKRGGTHIDNHKAR